MTLSSVVESKRLYSVMVSWYSSTNCSSLPTSVSTVSRPSWDSEGFSTTKGGSVNCYTILSRELLNEEYISCTSAGVEAFELSGVVVSRKVPFSS